MEPAKGFENQWRNWFGTLYETYYCELACEALVSRWERIDLVTGFLVAITASGSTIAGWALWTSPGGKLVWASVASIAALASIARSVLGVAGRVKDQEEVRRLFSELRVELETFREHLAVAADPAQVLTEYDKLRAKFSQCMGRWRKDIALTSGLERTVKERLDGILRRKEHTK